MEGSRVYLIELLAREGEWCSVPFVKDWTTEAVLLEIMECSICAMICAEIFLMLWNVYVGIYYNASQ